MKRYRVILMDFDTRANVLGMEVKGEWDAEVREPWLKGQAAIREGLAEQLGVARFDAKLANFVAMGAAPFSVVAFHNHFFSQIRIAFSMGAYYPSLTATCALGERILNHLILRLRDDYLDTPAYKRVHRRDSFDNWDLAIDTLASWAVLLPEAADLFRKLKDLRHRTLHFNPETDRDARPPALQAIALLQQILTVQFGSWGNPWYIPDAHGLSFVRRSHETVPFVKRVVLPSCRLVGPRHDLHRDANGMWQAVDDHEYPDEEISDEEYVRAFVAAH